jgi:hypothetical protein
MKQRPLLRLAAAVAAALVIAGCGEVRAADPAATPAAAPAAPAKSATTETPAPDAAGPAPGAKPTDGKASPLHFEPTEKTRADFEVSFPTDI